MQFHTSGFLVDKQKTFFGFFFSLTLPLTSIYVMLMLSSRWVLPLRRFVAAILQAVGVGLGGSLVHDISYKPESIIIHEKLGWSFGLAAAASGLYFASAVLALVSFCYSSMRKQSMSYTSIRSDNKA